MFKPLTPDSDPAEIAAFVDMLPRLASLLNTDAKAKRLLEESGQGKLDDLDLALGLAARLAAAEGSDNT
jgi:hypothetical protein